jgi:hypothetical protein
VEGQSAQFRQWRAAERSLPIFTSPLAFADQESLRRYLIGRYADHPAVLGWKLWSEINLTAAGEMGRRRGQDAGGIQVSDDDRHHALLNWHERAAARWHALDSYGHGVTTHWSGDYRQPEFDIVALPGLDYICIDAYLNRRRDGAWVRTWPICSTTACRIPSMVWAASTSRCWSPSMAAPHRGRRRRRSVPSWSSPPGRR